MAFVVEKDCNEGQKCSNWDDKVMYKRGEKHNEQDYDYSENIEWIDDFLELVCLILNVFFTCSIVQI